MLLAPRHRVEERVVLDRDDVLEPDGIAVAGHEVAVERIAVAAVHGREATRREVVVDEVDAQLVELLQVPGERALRSVHLERHLALRPDHRPRGLEAADGPAGEADERPAVVLVGHLTGRIVRAAARVVRASGARQRAAADERLAHPDHLADRADQEMGEVDSVAEDVARHAVAALVLEEAPGQQTHRVVAVHREEPPAVVRDLAQPPGLDQRAGVHHERHEAVVVPDTGDDAGPPGCRTDAHRLLGCAADGLLAEQVLAGLGGGDAQLLVEHVRRRHSDNLDVGVLDDPPPVVAGLLEAERRRRLVAACRHGVGTGDQPRLERTLGEQRRDAPVRPAVGLAHPAEADDPDPDRPPLRHD